MAILRHYFPVDISFTRRVALHPTVRWRWERVRVPREVMSLADIFWRERWQKSFVSGSSSCTYIHSFKATTPNSRKSTICLPLWHVSMLGPLRILFTWNLQDSFLAQNIKWARHFLRFVGPPPLPFLFNSLFTFSTGFDNFDTNLRAAFGRNQKPDLITSSVYFVATQIWKEEKWKMPFDLENASLYSNLIPRGPNCWVSANRLMVRCLPEILCPSPWCRLYAQMSCTCSTSAAAITPSLSLWPSSSSYSPMLPSRVRLSLRWTVIRSIAFTHAHYGW